MCLEKWCCFSKYVSLVIWDKIVNQGFHKLDEIGNNANIDIRGFTMWKQKIAP